jgi:anaerobic magnesium-protoporphyrin IX monomethyl ester cyclase
MAKILLCHPLFLSLNPEEQAMKSPYFPLGLLYLAGFVRAQGHAVAVFDGTFEENVSAFSERLAAEQPDIVGISAVLPLQEMALTLAAEAKAHGALTVLGGPDPTLDPQRYLQFPQVDIVVHHEGEQTLDALLRLVDAGPITPELLLCEPGIAYRDAAGRPVVNQPRPLIENLDELPLPARDLIDMGRYLDTWREENGYSSLTISTARGCPYACDWCRDAVHGQGFRQRSPENVAAEMKQLKETYDIDRLRVVDDVDGIERDWVEGWAAAANAADAVIPFEALYDLERQDLPMLDVRDTL